MINVFMPVQALGFLFFLLLLLNLNILEILFQMCKKYLTLSLFNSFLQPTVPSEGRLPPRIGNIGHLTRISNKLIQLGNNSAKIQAYLQV